MNGVLGKRTKNKTNKIENEENKKVNTREGKQT